MLSQQIKEIQTGIKTGQYLSEAQVVNGIVLRVLNFLEWPIYDTQIVIPEYKVEGRRVDLALCHPKNKPIVFIEIKQIGKIEGADKQLFEYAFHTGVPMAIVTDGQEWHFYLPAEQGKYLERRVYKLDLLERNEEEIINRLTRYLQYDKVLSGDAIDLARKDYKNIHKEREIRQSVPIAWQKMIEEHDEILVELLVDKVESICGYKPDPDIIATFFDSLKKITDAPIQPKIQKHAVAKQVYQRSSSIGFQYKGESFNCKNAIDVMVNVFEKFNQKDNSFHSRFASLPKHGRKRRYLAETKEELYPGRQDLAEECSIQLSSGFWLGSNYSRADIKKIIILACEVFGCQFGEDLIINLG